MSEQFHADRTIIEGTVDCDAKQDISSVLQPLFDEAGVSSHHTEVEEIHIERNDIQVKLRPTPRFEDNDE